MNEEVTGTAPTKTGGWNTVDRKGTGKKSSSCGGWLENQEDEGCDLLCTSLRDLSSRGIIFQVKMHRLEPTREQNRQWSKKTTTMGGVRGALPIHPP